MPDMPVRTIRYVAALAEQNNFGRAAQKLGIATPTLSVQVRRLEDSLGAALFRRSRSGVALTKLGAEFLDAAAPMLQADDDLQAWLAQATGRGGGIDVGIVAGGMHDLGPLILARLRRDRPGVDISVHTVAFGAVTSEIVSGRCDLVVTSAPFDRGDDAGIERVHIRGAPRIVIMSAEHRLADRSSVTFAELEGEVFLVPTDVAPATLAWWLGDGAPDDERPRHKAIGPDFEGILAAVGAGMGVTLSSTETESVSAKPDLRFVRVSDALPASVVIAFHAGRRDPLVRAFVGLSLRLARESIE